MLVISFIVRESIPTNLFFYARLGLGKGFFDFKLNHSSKQVYFRRIQGLLHKAMCIENDVHKGLQWAIYNATLVFVCIHNRPLYSHVIL